MAAWGDIFGAGSSAEQLLVWQVGGQLIATILAPVLASLQQELWEGAVSGSGGAVHQAPSPADLADWVVRGITTEADVSGVAAQSGIQASDFANMVHNAGEPPGLQFMLEAWRRGYIGWDDTGVDQPSVDRGIKTSRIYDYWAGVIQKMAVQPISVADAVAAVLRGQIPHDQGQQAAYQNGITAPDFQVLLNTAGRPPAPEQLVEMVRRGFIPLRGSGPDALSFEQGIFEGDQKDKWEPIFEHLTDYLPPPRTVTALERSGAITAARAQKLYQDAGLSPDLAAAYSKNASGEKLSGSKQLALGTILTLHETQALDTPTASSLLAQLGYSPADVTFLLELSDLQRELKFLDSAIGRVHTLYVSHKLTRQATVQSLAGFGVTGAHQTQLLATWDAEAAANVRLPTPAQIESAWEYGVIDQPTALAELQRYGYTPYDAWLILSVKAKGALPGRPAQGPAGPGTV